MLYIGIDCGGTKTTVGIVRDGIILDKMVFSDYSEQKYEFFLGKLASTINQIVLKNGFRFSMVDGIGLVVPGILDYDNGIIIESPNLPNFNGKNIVNDIKKMFSINAKIENDANAYIMGEVSILEPIYKNIIGLTLGTGIGGAIFFNREIYHGSHGIAGELGHTIVMPNGPFCGCGKQGCIEAIASGTGIVKFANYLLNHRIYIGTTKLTKNLADADSKYIFSLANEENDNFAKYLINRMLKYLAIALSNYINVLDPDIIIIGGGFSNAFSDEHWNILSNFVHDSVFHVNKNIEIRKAKLGNDAPIIGAVSLF